MNLMDWDPKKFDVLIPKMNDQHQKLISIMNKLYDRHKSKASKDELNKLFIELRDYTLLHFREEEAMFDSMQFPQAAQHKMIHKALLKDFTTHYEKFQKGAGEVEPEFFDFLKLWLTSHIMHVDHKYGEFSQQQKTA